MTFSEVLSILKGGEAVQRRGWNGKGMFIMLQLPGENGKMSLPYIFMYTVQGDLVPWLASQTDLLSDDWQRAVGVIGGQEVYLGTGEPVVAG